jgi:hypothetical protein
MVKYYIGTWIWTLTQIIAKCLQKYSSPFINKNVVQTIEHILNWHVDNHFMFLTTYKKQETS